MSVTFSSKTDDRRDPIYSPHRFSATLSAHKLMVIYIVFTFSQLCILFIIQFIFIDANYAPTVLKNVVVIFRHNQYIEIQ